MILQMIEYSHNETGPRTAYNIRSNCAIGHSLRPKDFRDNLRELWIKRVYDKVPLGGGRYGYELTELGEILASIPFDSSSVFKTFLEVLDLPTAFHFGGQGWKNNCTDTF
jgi:hypothetical protein